MHKFFIIRIFCIALFTLGVASCGFTPIYATGSQTAQALSDITVAPPKNSRAEYILAKELEERLGRNLNGSMILEYGIQLSEEGIESVADRIQVIGRVDYNIVSSVDRSFIFGGSVDNFVSYSNDGILLNPVTQGSFDRLMPILADQIIAELIAQLPNSVSE